MKRSSRGCRSCRARHTKCTREDSQSGCIRCQETKQECIFDPAWPFKPVKYVDTASQGVRTRTELVYDPDQPWVSSRNIVKFVPEDGSGHEVDATAIAQVQSFTISSPLEQHTFVDSLSSAQQTPVEPEDTSLPVLTGPGPDQAVQSLSEIVPTEEPSTYQTVINGQDVIQNWNTTESHPVLSQSPSNFLHFPSNAGSVNASAGLPILSTGNSRILGTDSLANSPAVGFATSSGLTATTLSHREVRLVQHFVHRLSPWVSNEIQISLCRMIDCVSAGRL
jgi:plastocyanin